MFDDPFPGYGLRSVTLADRGLFQSHFATLQSPLSDYTFSQIFTWRNSLHLSWKILAGHLCIFANGCGDLTLLIPPIGDTQSNQALNQAFELMDQYNTEHAVPDHSRVEYVSDELLARFDRANLNVAPMGTDYLYDVNRMIDLAGGDLASKRQAKNRFTRLYSHQVETYRPEHLDACVALLQNWRTHQDAQHLEESNINSIKRHKETLATELALRHASELNLAGMVVLAADSAEPGQTMSLRGFTFGEPLGSDQSSVVIEKTDLQFKGLAQFIFSEFCRDQWASRPFVNVGDDWGLESLAWTKMSYRPVKLLQKYALTKAQTATALVSCDLSTPSIRQAGKDDLAATAVLEKACFSSDLSLKKRQLQYLQRRKSAVFLVAEQAGQVIGEGIALVRQHKTGLSGRIYSLAVDEKYRGQKIGAKLLKAMVNQLSERGVKRIYLEVDPANQNALALYQAAGFGFIGRLPNYYHGQRDAHHMMLGVKTAAAQIMAQG